MTLDEIDTPAAVVDLDRLQHNLERAAGYARSHGLALRPHVKTHKSLVVAREQLRLGASGLTCATPFETRVMSVISDDLLNAFPPVGPGRAHRLMALNSRVKLTVALDSREAVDMLQAAARAAGRRVGVYVELDVGMRRVGLGDPSSVVSLSRYVTEQSSLEFTGVALYPGHIRGATHEQDAGLERLNSDLNSTLDALDTAGLTPAVVSAGSTPTLWRTHELPRVTEIRPGSYVYNDRTIATLGACDWSDCALTVLATVVSTSVNGQAVIDAGSKALGREPMASGETAGFGELLNHPEVRVARMSEEHGVLDLTGSTRRLRVGERVRVIPNHVCVAVSQFDVTYGARGETLETAWRIDARGRGHELLPGAVPAAGTRILAD
ncbi:MAG: alanine racemase [Gemmatimonadota bacterium]|nr:alanine racemase [Gemmatimonadota bacterium]